MSAADTGAVIRRAFDEAGLPLRLPDGRPVRKYHAIAAARQAHLHALLALDAQIRASERTSAAPPPDVVPPAPAAFLEDTAPRRVEAAEAPDTAATNPAQASNVRPLRWRERATLADLCDCLVGGAIACLILIAGGVAEMKIELSEERQVRLHLLEELLDHCAGDVRSAVEVAPAALAFLYGEKPQPASGLGLPLEKMERPKPIQGIPAAAPAQEKLDYERIGDDAMIAEHIAVKGVSTVPDFRDAELNAIYDALAMRAHRFVRLGVGRTSPKPWSLDGSAPLSRAELLARAKAIIDREKPMPGRETANVR